jgi:hypothetical protein
MGSRDEQSGLPRQLGSQGNHTTGIDNFTFKYLHATTCSFIILYAPLCFTMFVLMSLMMKRLFECLYIYLEVYLFIYL